MDLRFEIEDLTLENVLDLYNVDLELEGVDSVLFDFRNMYKVEPLAMLLFSKRLRSMKAKYPKVSFKATNFDGNSYAAHMGFFKSFGLQHGKQPGEALGSVTYIPITKLDVKTLRMESYDTDQGVVQEVIVRKAKEMAGILCGNNLDIKNSLFQCIREILRNIVEHSESETIWLAAQRWGYQREIEIGILDEGVGIAQTLKVNPHLTISDVDAALELALQPAISGKAFMYQGQERGKIDGVWDHSGYGLYIASQISKMNGTFFICSGDSSLYISEQTSENIPYDHLGTAIRIRVNLDSLIEFTQNDIDEIINRGQKIAAEKYSSFALSSASAASKKSLQN
ncbi:ATP-binding protein [Sporosarcina sp. ACRSL]|uniref:ATP-binding protein n=1 Tax=Sporosarcina sp. ACRSL TaxID=2918215 RepID=UPI001EF541C5|nr:ATP-binding protein [Sporosarcina sp. ACRSL]MCG7346105.1 ATP-binding protein [Sporosarcina sp. ACRSL]